MNKEVEQRIVEMQFNNSDFEAKVQKSLETLHKLKDATKLEDAGKGLDNLAKSAKNVDLSSIAAGIEKLNERFSGLGIVGITVMQRLTNAAIDMGQQMASAITAAPRDGWKEYELNLDSVKTILNSAKDANGLPVTLDKVNQKLAELNAYSDKTIYSFSDMTNNIGKFTNAGVDLDSAVTAIQGVANAAALAGADANDASIAMYNFGQALGSGSVKLVDWKSIQTAHMDTVAFKEELIKTAEELHVLKKEGDKYVSTTTNMQGKISDAFNATEGFNESLAHQWMTSEVLTKTLAKYTDESTDLGKAAIDAATKVTTFSKLIETLKESMGSGWMTSWQYIFGDFNEASELWTYIYQKADGIISTIAAFRNNFLKDWRDSGGREALLGSLKNTYETVEFYVQGVAKALGLVVPDPDENLVAKTFDSKPVVAVTKAIEGVTEVINPVFDKAEKIKTEVEETSKAVDEVADHAEKLAELTQEIMQGKWGNGEERKKKLEEAGYAYENLQNAVNEAMGVEKRYETTVSDRVAVGLEDIDTTKKQAAADEEAAKATEKRAGVIESLANILRAVGSSVQVVKAGFGAVLGTLQKGAFLIDILKDGFKFFLSVLGGFANRVTAFNTWIMSFKSVEGFFTGLRRNLRQSKDEFGKMGVSIENIQKLVTLLESGYKQAKASIKKFFDTVKNGVKGLDLDKLYTSVMEIGKFVGGVLILAFEALAGAITTAVDGVTKLYDKIKNMYIVQKLIGYFNEFKTSLSNTAESIKNATFYSDTLVPFLSELGDTLKRIGDAIGPVFVKAFEKFIEILDKINNKTVSAFSALQKDGVIDTATNVINDFKEAIWDIPGAMAQFMESFKTTGKVPELTTFPEKVQNFVNSIVTFFETLRTSAGNMISGKVKEMGDFVKALPTNTELGPFNTFVTTLGKAFDDFQGTVDGAKGTITDFADNVIGKLSKIDFKGFAITALIGSIALFVFRWSKIGKSASFTIKAIGKFILNGGKIATTAVDKYNGFLKIAAAIGIIAGSVWLLSTVPADRFAACVGVLVGAFAAMFGVIEAFTIQKIPAEDIKAVGIAFGGMGVALLAIVVAAKILAGMKTEEMIKGGAAIAVLTYMIVKAAKEAEKVGTGAGLAFLGLSLAVLMLIPSIKLLSGMDAHTLIKGGAAVFAFTQILARAAKEAGDAKGSFGAFTGLSLALLLLIPSIKILAGMKFGELLKGGVAVYAFLKMMTTAAKEAGDGGKGFLGMGIAIGIIAVSLKILESIKWSSLMASTMALKGILDSVAKAMATVSAVPWKSMVKALLGMAACLVVVGGALLLMDKLGNNSDDTLKNALGMTAILWAFAQLGPSIAILSAIPFAAGVQAAANAMVFFGAMTICLGALGGLSEFGDGKMGEAILNGAGMIGKILRSLVDGFLLTDDVDIADVLSGIGDALSGFGSKISGFLTALTETDISVVDKAKSLAMAIMALGGAELLEALTSWASGKSSTTTFAEGVSAITGAIIQLNTDLADVTIDKKKFSQLTGIIESMVDLANAMPKQGGILQDWTGAKDLSKFADDMNEMIKGGLSSFIGSVNILAINAGTVAKVLSIATVTGAMTKLANSLPESGVLSWFIDGGHDLGAFAAQMANFMKNGFVEFVTATNSAPDVSLDKINGQIIPAAEAMIALGEKIQNKEGIFAAFSRQMDLGGFGATLKQFGTGISEFCASIAGADPSHIDPITASMERLAALNASDDISSGNLGAFSAGINGLGGALKQFVTDTSGFNSETVGTMIDKLTSLHNLMLILSATDYSGVTGFSQALYDLAKTGGEEFLAGFESSASDAESAVQAMFEAIQGEIAAKADSFGKAGVLCAAEYVKGFTTFFGVGFLLGAGKYLVDTVIKGVGTSQPEFSKKALGCVAEFCVGVNNSAGLLNGAGEKIVAKTIEGIKNKQNDFFKEGQYAAEGYARGIADRAWRAKEEAERAAEAAKKKIAEINDSASPAKEYMKLGRYAMEGYALGFIQNTKDVVSAVSESGYSGLEVMSETVQKMRALLDGSLDYQPTITPVWDMSNITGGVNRTNSMLSDLKVATTGVTAAIDIANAHNAELARKSSQKIVDYSTELGELISNTRKIISATKENRYAIIDDGEMTKMVNYVDEQFGIA